MLNRSGRLSGRGWCDTKVYMCVYVHTFSLSSSHRYKQTVDYRFERIRDDYKGKKGRPGDGASDGLRRRRTMHVIRWKLKHRPDQRAFKSLIRELILESRDLSFVATGMIQETTRYVHTKVV